MIASSGQLLDLVVAALLGPNAQATPSIYATAAGAGIFRPGDWPTQGGQYPRLKARITGETKQSIARSGPPEFTVLTTIRVIGEVSEPAAVNDAGATAAEASLWALERDVEIAVIGSYPLSAEIQQIASVNSQLDYNSDGETHLAGVQIDFGIEWYQGPEAFAPIASGDLDAVHLELTDHTPSGLDLYLQS